METTGDPTRAGRSSRGWLVPSPGHDPRMEVRHKTRHLETTVDSQHPQLITKTHFSQYFPPQKDRKD